MAMADERDHSADETLGLLLDPGHEHAAPDVYPGLWNMSAGFMCKAVVRPEDPARPEYVTVPLRPGIWDDANLALSVAISKWNSTCRPTSRTGSRGRGPAPSSVTSCRSPIPASVSSRPTTRFGCWLAHNLDVWIPPVTEVIEE